MTRFTRAAFLLIPVAGLAGFAGCDAKPAPAPSAHQAEATPGDEGTNRETASPIQSPGDSA